MARFAVGLCIACLVGTAQASVSASLAGGGPRSTGQRHRRRAGVDRPSAFRHHGPWRLAGANGAFFQGGLRVGGPFTLSFRAAGYRSSRLTGVMLRPGRQPPLTVALTPAAEEEVLVTATAPAAGGLNNGVGSAYTAEDISRQPGIHRDVIRTLLNDPLAQSQGEGNLSVAGANPRFNGLVIDGSRQEDDFGLGTSTYATARSPINLDAVESASLVASDYSVTASGFTGGLVRITTKSGGNEWDGAAFFYRHHDGLVGDRYQGGTFSPGEFKETEAGLSSGRPHHQGPPVRVCLLRQVQIRLAR